MVRSTIRPAIAVLVGLLLVMAAPPVASAAERTEFELPAATHAGPIAVAADGTAWFVPVRGSRWRGHNDSILGRVAPDGSVSELKVPGFSTLDDVASGPEGGVWVSGLRGRPHHEVIAIAQLSPTGAFLRRYTIGRGGIPVTAMAVSAETVWLIREHWRPKVSLFSIEGVNVASGAVGAIRLPSGCRAYAITVAGDGTPWFTQKCGGFRDDGSTSKTSVGHIAADGTVVRQPIAAKDYPKTLTLGPEGTVWFGAWAFYEPNRIGRLTASGELQEFTIENGSINSIAIGPEGRLWFSTRHGSYTTALVSIGVDGSLGTSVCADPTCSLEPTAITSAPDGSLWYGLIRPNYNTGGGASGILIDEEIHNQAGFVGHLVVPGAGASIAP